MIDFHCHLLPGLDDGPETMDESLAMALALQNAGFKTIYCTPHAMKGYYDADNKAVLSAISDLRTRLKDENINLEILPGREYYLDEFLGSYLKQPLPLGKTKYIMIEIPNYVLSSRFIKEAFFRIKCGGFIPMIAHPERCRLFAVPKKKTISLSWLSSAKNKTSGSKTKEHSLINYLKEIGCAFQGNIGSFEGLYGAEVQKTAEYLKETKVITHYGTDAHSLQAITRLNMEPMNLELKT
ncbi:MAG: hypothetical protein JW976_03310 [Syntrophaceae bacterium]|nr:hypothetical protein [Syntrophaceae bacterium]